MFGGHGLLPARRSFSPIKDLKFLESVKSIRTLIFSQEFPFKQLSLVNLRPSGQTAVPS